MKAIKTKVVITGVRAKVDGSLGISFSTPELSSEEKVAFMELQNMNCDALFNPLDEEAVDLVEVKSELGSKTSSQRVRAILYILYKQNGAKGTFEDYYRSQMEKIIEWLKEKIEQ